MFRFVLVGGGLFALDLVLFMALVEGIALGVGWAQLVSVSVRTVVGFFVHKWFTFRGDTADTAGATAGQGVEVRNWSSSWNDGRAFLAVLRAYFPDDVPPAASVDAGAREANFKLAFRLAEERAGVPPLLDVQDMLDCYPKPDDKSVMTYVSMVWGRCAQLSA